MPVFLEAGESRESLAWWPRPSHRALLQIAFAGADAIEAAWEEWAATNDLDVLDAGLFQLLPLVYRNLTLHRVDTPLMGKLRGVYRYVWVRNHLLLNRAAPFLHELRGLGVDATLLKGAALISTHYRDVGLRPIGDVDIHVAARDAPLALKLLERAGWASLYDVSFRDIERFVTREAHAHNFVHTSGGAIDLHWNVFGGYYRGATDAGLHAHAVAGELLGTPIRVLDPTGQIVHACIHGITPNPIPPFRWLADVATIFRSSYSDISWDRLLQYARDHRLHVPMHNALTFAREVMGLPVPGEFLAQLRRTPVRFVDWGAYRLQVQSGRKTVPMAALYVWLEHRRAATGMNAWARALSLPGFLQRRYRLPHARQVPAEVLRKVARFARVGGWV